VAYVVIAQLVGRGTPTADSEPPLGRRAAPSHASPRRGEKENFGGRCCCLSFTHVQCCWLFIAAWIQRGAAVSRRPAAAPRSALSAPGAVVLPGESSQPASRQLDRRHRPNFLSDPLTYPLTARSRCSPSIEAQPAACRRPYITKLGNS